MPIIGKPLRNSDSIQVVRLDVALLERGLIGSRSKAQRLIADGKVSVNGVDITKVSTKSAAMTSSQSIGETITFPGRIQAGRRVRTVRDAGLRSAQGLHCLDIGASTGGFCDVLLRNDAAQVIALDVGHGQLDPKIAYDDRIIEMSGVNVRDVYVDDLPYRPEMIVSDVSFISLTYVIPVIARIAAPQAQIVLLVKPQFEVGKGNLGKNGIVESRELRERALTSVVACAERNGLDVRATTVSPIEGTHGNIEYLLYAVMQ